MMHTRKLAYIYYFIDNFNTNILKNLDKKINLVYRNYKTEIDKEELSKFWYQCKKKGISLYLANNINLAFNLKLNGAYIPAFNRKMIVKNYENYKNFVIIGSAHNIDEINIKKKQKVKKIFISPLFKNKKTNKYLGVIKFNKLSTFINKDVIALGGINKSNINLLKLTNANGIAGISFLKNGAKLKI